ncbi:MAG: flagellar biosynthetic protein FliO [Ignavibacteria bacterium]|nr:flagellar biosynthetic protein FliO [Ignavibacteria bacterium]
MDGAILKSFAILLASVGIVFIVLMLIKKYSSKLINQPNKFPLKIVAKLPLGQKSFLCVVEADGKTLLVGVTDKSINLISQLKDEFDYTNIDLKQVASKTKKIKSAETESKSKDLSFMNFLKDSIGLRAREN